MIKLSDKLEVIGITHRLKLLIDGEIFYTFDGKQIKCMDWTFFLGNEAFGNLEPEFVLDDWYYPAPTYTINGVELVDERVKELEIGFKEYYVCDCIRSDYFNYANSVGTPTTYLQKVIERNLLHKTKEAAVLHTKAMMKVAA